MSTRPSARSQRGFTLVEVMVAIFVLLVGVLGVVSMVDGANAVTSKTRAREGGTNIARSIIEISRSVRYRDLTADALLAELDTRPGLGDVDTGTDYDIRARAVDYSATITVCSLDDPQDGLGNHNGPVAYCSDSNVLAAGAPATDRNPDDYKRVRVTLSWTTRQTGQSITQTSSIINPVGGLGPSVTGLVMQSPSSVTADPLLIEADVDTATFRATTSTSAANVTWSVSGKTEGQATGGPKTWLFDWDITDPATNEPIYYDCTYVIQADAFDGQGRSGAPFAKTVRLNRMLPLKPSGFAGGRNGNGNIVDLAWVSNPECDVVGYRIFSGDSATTITTPVTCLGASSATLDADADECIHPDAPPGNVWYKLVALDTPSGGGAPREGAASDPLAIGPVSSNNVPTAPTGLSSCIGGQAGCLVANGVPADDGVLVIRWLPSVDSDGTIQLYRFYRDGITYGERHASFYPKTGELLAWIEPEPDSSSHDYRITAVDDDFGESAPSDVITASP